MTWTYGHPQASPKDAVRFLVGDTKKDSQQRQDEEITFSLTECANDIYLAGALICDSLASEHARDADKTNGDVREQLSQVSRAYAARAVELRTRSVQGQTGAGVIAVAPFVGGLSQSRVDSAEADTDFLGSAFRPGMFDAH